MKHHLRLARSIRLWLAAWVWMTAAAFAVAAENADRVDLLPTLSYWLAPETVDSQAKRVDRSDAKALQETRRFSEVLERLRQSGTAPKDFAPVRQRPAETNFGFIGKDIWLYSPLALPSRRDALGYVLHLPYAPLDDIHVWILDDQWRILTEGVSGDQHPFSKRSVPHREHAFRLSGAVAQSGKHVLMRVRSSGVTEVTTRVWTSSGFEQYSQSSYAGYAMYLGLAFGLALFNFLLWLFVKQARFGWYAAFTVFTALTQLALSGLGFQYVWPEALAWQNRAVAFAMACSGFFAALFARSFLRTYLQSPIWDRALLLVALWAIVSLLAVIALPLRYSSMTNSIMAVLGVIAVVGASWDAINRGEEGAGMFLGAWSFFLMGVLVMVAHNNAWIESNTFSANALLFGSAVELILLSLVLGNNLRIAQLDKDAALELAADEKAIADHLAESEARNRALLAERDGILNSAVVGMVVTRDGKIEWANGKALAMFGYSEESMLGMSADALFKERGDWWRLGRRARVALRQHGSYEGELQLKRADGQTFWAMVGGSALGQTPDAGTVWSILDVQAQHESQEQLRNTLIEQRKLTSLRARFVAMASHELRTPLASILSTQELLTHYQDRLSDGEKAELLEQIRSSAQRLWDMTERMLLQGKAEAGRLECEPQLCDAEAIVRETALSEHAHFAPPSADVQTGGLPSEDDSSDTGVRAASGARPQLVFDIPKPLGQLCVDPKLLHHIVSNLVSNALKYSPLGGTVRVILERQNVQDQEILRLEIHDEGIGIPQSALTNIFESFHRASNVGDIAGTGIGLSIVKQCVDAHGGEIFIESFEGQGTRVMVNLPEQNASTSPDAEQGVLGDAPTR